MLYKRISLVYFTIFYDCFLRSKWTFDFVSMGYLKHKIQKDYCFAGVLLSQVGDLNNFIIKNK